MMEHLLREIGPRWAENINKHRAQIIEAYTPLLAANPLQGLEVTRDVAYGAHARQRLDIYQGGEARRTGARLPLMVFVHGGAFLRGQKDSNDQVYGNVARFFARHGFVGVNVEYRLAPEAPFPAGSQDLALALDWLRANAAGFGGDAQRMLLVGHSAGGAHVASLLSDPRLQALAGPLMTHIAGAVLISARLRADQRADNPNAAGVRAYFGDDEHRYESDSPVSHAAHLRVPLLLAVAQYENPWLDVYAMEFAHRVGLAQGRSPQLVWVPEHNHTSIVAHLDSGIGDDSFGQRLLSFARGLSP